MGKVIYENFININEITYKKGHYYLCSNGYVLDRYQYRVYENGIKVRITYERKDFSKLLIPKVGSNVIFAVDTIPCKNNSKNYKTDNGVIKLQRSKTQLIPSENWQKWLEFKMKGSVNIKQLFYCKRFYDGKGIGDYCISFWGNGKVEDKDVLEDILLNGIGKLKSYGLGMVEIRENDNEN